ncbi:HNH endonuclease signature motif containing protein [Georgenia subflava]|uniref:HNH nuclease domain-containing protein n=1 Tax=Georgenia subflava TaxID=1622177 RepID=A0A6N7EKG1_9MICO|nr:HNH endonuclease signature motif containing protein [Georgenia subflava]MPV36686.1 hypothetical protein [Georgenia subflava]
MPPWWPFLQTGEAMRCGSPATTHTQIKVTVPLNVLLAGQNATTDDDTGPGDASSASDGHSCTCGSSASGGLVDGRDRGEGPAIATEPPDGPLPEVAVLHGYGPITGDVARALAAGGTWRRLITDPVTGTVLDHGRTRYRPPEDLQEHVRLRDTTCVLPGCSVPAQRCQIDHTIPWSQGGHTADTNHGPLCTRDHTLKTVGAFTVVQPQPGIFEWTTPTGHVYRRESDGTITMLPARRRSAVPSRADSTANGSDTAAAPGRSHDPWTGRDAEEGDPPPF